MRTADAIVVGAGVIGVSVACALAREGLAVVVLERDAIGAHASSVAAGMLAPIAEAHGGHDLLPLGLASLALFPAHVAEIHDRTGVDPHFAASGLLRVAQSEGEAERLRARAEGLAAYGVVWLDAPEARAHEPQLAPGVAGAFWSPREGHVDAALLTSGTARVAEAHGARFACGDAVVALLREGSRVAGVRTTRETWSAPWVVLATGPWAGDALAAVPVRPVRGQLLVLHAAPPLASIVWGDAVYVVPRHDGRVLAGATMEEVGFDCRVTVSGVSSLLEAGSRLLPALAGARFDGARAALRPATPDGLPLVGASPGSDGLLLAAGHHRNGILLAPITGRLVADLVLGRPPSDEARAFDPDRFHRSPPA